jgi:hypothetical protein
MRPEERLQLHEILSDLRDEESDQEAQHGYASTRVSRSVARLSHLLASADEGEVLRLPETEDARD